MINKEADATELFMSQKLKLDGDMGLAMEFGAALEDIDPKSVLSLAGGSGGGSSSGGSSGGSSGLNRTLF
eukprot:UN26659